MPATTPMLMTAARKSAERRICVCIAVVPLCSSPLTNTADIPIGILSFFRHKYENSFFGIGNNKKIHSVAILGGSGADFIYSIPDVDIYLTGDVGYHAALDAIEMKKNIIDIGHFSEHLVKELLQDYIRELNIVVEQSKVEKTPFVIL